MKIICQRGDTENLEPTITLPPVMTFGSLKTSIAEATNILLQNLVLSLKGKERHLGDKADIHEAWSPEDLVAVCERECLSEGNYLV